MQDAAAPAANDVPGQIDDPDSGRVKEGADAGRLVKASLHGESERIDAVHAEVRRFAQKTFDGLRSWGQNKSSPKSYAKAERNRNDVVVRTCSIRSLWIAVDMRQF